MITKREAELLSRGFQTCGNSMNAFFYIEEKLTVSKVLQPLKYI